MSGKIVVARQVDPLLECWRNERRQHFNERHFAGIPGGRGGRGAPVGGYFVGVGGNTSPVVTTQAVTSIGSTSATGNGTVVSDGGSTITQRGICWSTHSNPSTSDSTSTASGTVGVFSASITGLTASTLYHVRAYAINAIGTSYGADVSFTSASSGGSVTGPISLSRDIASAGGGCLITVTAVATSGSPSVTVNGVSAGSATNIDGTHCSFNVPAVSGITAITTVTVVVGGVTAPNQFQLAPAPSGAAFSAWHDLTGLGSYSTDLSSNGTVAASTDFALPSTTHSLKCTVTVSGTGGTARAISPLFSVADNVYPHGVWGRWWWLMTAASYANNGTNLKVHLARRWPSESQPIGYILTNGGGGLPANNLGYQTDFDTGGTAEGALGNLYNGTWYEFLVYYSYNTSTSKGTMRLWMNGLSISGATVTSASAGSTNTDYAMDRGLSFINTCTGTVTDYIADLWEGDGCPDPQTIS